MRDRDYLCGQQTSTALVFLPSWVPIVVSRPAPLVDTLRYSAINSLLEAAISETQDALVRHYFGFEEIKRILL